MYIRTGDPLEDFARHDAEQESRLDKLPKCESCGEPIEDDYFYNIDGFFLCEECLKSEYRVNTDDYIED